MSHTVRVKSVKIRSIAALQSAVHELNSQGIHCSLKENTEPRMYYRNQLSKNDGLNDICPYVVFFEDSWYDIGLVANEDGTFDTVFDDFSYGSTYDRGSDKKSLPSLLGKGAGKLLQEYTKAAVIEEATLAGHTVESVTFGQNGEIHIEINDGSNY